MWRAGIGLLAIVIPSTAAAQTGTGAISVNLGIPLQTILLSSSIEVVNPSIGFDETVLETRGPGGFTISDLPAADNYTVYVRSTAPNDVVCSGYDPNFPIVSGGTTIVFVSLTCMPRSAIPAPALGRFAPLLGLLLASLGALAIHTLARRPRRACGPVP